jgi:hypothetical protein
VNVRKTSGTIVLNSARRSNRPPASREHSRMQSNGAPASGAPAAIEASRSAPPSMSGDASRATLPASVPASGRVETHRPPALQKKEVGQSLTVEHASSLSGIR